MNTSRSSFWRATLMLGLFACASTPPATSGEAPKSGQNGGAATVPTPVPPTGASIASAAKVTSRRVFTDNISSVEMFKDYSRQVGTERFTKFIVDIKSGRVYYFDVNVYKLHVDFVFSELYKTKQTRPKLISFNRNYESSKPEFLLCYLVHHTDQDVWTFAFWEGDLATEAHVATAYKRMKETFALGEKVKFRPDSTLQEALMKGLKARAIPTVTNDVLYKASSYQAFTTGTSVGKLRIVKGDGANPQNFDPEELVILTDVLPDITPVRGIISERFSTPLAHVALRARAWGIPHVGLRGAAKTYKKLAGKWVVFEATPAKATLRQATAKEVAADKARRSAARRVQLPKADLKVRGLKWLPKIRAAEAGAYGAKTANLGEMAHANLPGFDIPQGFGIPVSYYATHLAKHGIDAAISTLLSDPRVNKDSSYRHEALKQLRELIVSKPLSDELKQAVGERLKTLGMGPERGIFIRSSTNAEDLPGFNGAGLYDTVPNVKTPEAAFAAIKRVWASVWNRRAFDERAHFGIDHNGVYGAILVQIGVNATAAGVLITANIFDRADRNSYTINAKSGLGMRVVEGKKIPEQLIFDTSNFGIKVLSRSDEDTMLIFDDEGGVKEVPNPDKGKPILSDDRAMRLALAAKSVTRLFPPDKPLDIEWLFEDELLYLVQSRPYIGH